MRTLTGAQSSIIMHLSPILSLKKLAAGSSLPTAESIQRQLDVIYTSDDPQARKAANEALLRALCRAASNSEIAEEKPVDPLADAETGDETVMR